MTMRLVSTMYHWLSQTKECHTAHKAVALLCIMHCALCIALSSCARIGTPDGGPYDETPPKVVRTTPKYGSANVKNAKKIVIEFDEIVKIDNAAEKVVISPPQIEQPEIEASGKKVIVTLNDSLKPNVTYTIDFADAIVDNNEGNPYGDYAFTFSTGEQVDTFQVSGHVLDASNLEPIKGMLVGLYAIPPAGTDTLGMPNDTTTHTPDGVSPPPSGMGVLPDTLFRTTPFQRISRTDGSGNFVIKGLAKGNYIAYALQDMNQNFIYDQRAERVAFSDRILSTSSRPDVRPDTVWHDSIHYDSIVMTPYTHYYPDDIVLMAFDSPFQDRHLLKSERPTPWQLTLYFTAGSDTLPLLTGLNFDATDAFVIDSNQHNDTIHYWLRDSLIYNIDTLDIQLDFYATDSTGNLALTIDTLNLVPKLTRAKIAQEQEEKLEEWAKDYKQKVKAERRAARKAGKDISPEKEALLPLGTEPDTPQEEEEDTLAVTEPEVPQKADKGKEKDKDSGKKKKKKKKEDDDDIVVPPMPEEFMEFKINGIQAITPDRNIDFEFPEPLDSVDLSKIHLSIKVDTLYQPTKFLFRQMPDNIKTYRLYAEWEPDTAYQLEIDTAAFVNIYGKRNEAQKRSITMKPLDVYSTLFVTLQGKPTTPSTLTSWDGALVQLLDGSDKVVKTIKAQNNKADFYFLTPGTYYMRLFHDLNGNGIWDTGDYDTHLQPEPVYYYPEALALKAQWEITQQWSPTSIPRAKQKPAKITKQKSDKAKSVKNRNAEREREKGR